MFLRFGVSFFFNASSPLELPRRATNRISKKTKKKVTHDMKALFLNTPINALMIHFALGPGTCCERKAEPSNGYLITPRVVHAEDKAT